MDIRLVLQFLVIMLHSPQMALSFFHVQGQIALLEKLVLRRLWWNLSYLITPTVVVFLLMGGSLPLVLVILFTFGTSLAQTLASPRPSLDMARELEVVGSIVPGLIT